MADTDVFSKIPNEVLLKIFSFLPPSEEETIRNVCERWRLLSSDKSLWQRVSYSEAGNNAAKFSTLPNFSNLLSSGSIMKIESVTFYHCTEKELDHIFGKFLIGNKGKTEFVVDCEICHGYFILTGPKLRRYYQFPTFRNLKFVDCPEFFSFENLNDLAADNPEIFLNVKEIEIHISNRPSGKVTTHTYKHVYYKNYWGIPEENKLEICWLYDILEEWRVSEVLPKMLKHKLSKKSARRTLIFKTFVSLFNYLFSIRNFASR